jgi:CO/xanthine dehydrogenase Mo-binding subunit
MSTSSESPAPAPALKWVGTSPPRKEGPAKITGQALYVDDIRTAGVLHGRTVRSPVARGRIRGVRFEPGVPWDEFIVATARDIPGPNVVTLIAKDQPLLADGEVRHVAEPVVLIAHPDRLLADRAVGLVKIDIEPLPAVLDLEEALAARQVVLPPDNIIKELNLLEGDPDAAFARSDVVVVVDDVYETAAQEQLYIETQGVLATAHPGRGISVEGSLQCPYYVHKALGPLFGLAGDAVRVAQTETGGAFGGKEEYPNLISGHAALLSWKADGRPVKMVYDRLEDLAATTKRHPSWTRVKAGFARDGTLLALDIDFRLNGGAYTTLSPVVLSRGILHSFGPYACANTRVRARAIATNCLPFGAFRGFGVPQSVFAIELHMTKAAHALGMDPVTLRRKNFLSTGDRMPTGQVVKERIDLDALVDRALVESGWDEKVRRFEAVNRTDPLVVRGMGLSVFFHGCGFTGDGEVILASRVAVRLEKEARAQVLVSNVEYGQGTNTVLAMIAAESLGVSLDRVTVHRPDTAVVPDSGPTVASRTTMVTGKLVERACHQIRETLEREASLPAGAGAADVVSAATAYVSAHGPLTATVGYEPPPGVHWDSTRYRGEPYGCYSWSADVAEVEIDRTTAEIRLVDFVSVVECGKVIHPLLAAGQIEGGAAQSIGHALFEDVVLADGGMANAQLTNYIIPTSADTPPIRVFFIEFPPDNPGPYQAKGIGELPADGPAAAVAGAVGHALSHRYVNRIPIFPEHVIDLLPRGPGSKT